MAEENKKEIDQEKKPKSTIIVALLLAILLIVAVIGGAFAYYFISVNMAKVKQEQVKPAYSKQLEPFTCNLEDGNFRRYARLTMTIEYTDKKLEKEIEENVYKIRDAVIAHIMGKRVADMTDRDKLRDELKNKINAELSHGDREVVTGIYFEEFIIQ